MSEYRKERAQHRAHHEKMVSSNRKMLLTIFQVQKNRRCIAFHFARILVRPRISCCSLISENIRADNTFSFALPSRSRLALPVPLLSLSPPALRAFSLYLFSSSLERDCCLSNPLGCSPAACHHRAPHTFSHPPSSFQSPIPCHSPSIAPAASAALDGSVLACYVACLRMNEALLSCSSRPLREMHGEECGWTVVGLKYVGVCEGNVR